MKNSILFLFCAFAFFWVQAVQADELETVLKKAEELQLGQDPQWRDLLHYRKNKYGFVRSQVMGPDFFLSPAGNKDFFAELKATLIALRTTKVAPGEDLPVCRFPARRKWLEKKLNLNPASFFPKADCKMYQFYRERMKAHSFSVVFSSYFADSPSSSFGHTLFRVNKTKPEDSKRNELLDWGLGYAGEVNTSNTFVYLYKGISGGFRGSYSSVPYYMKVREYNNYESRDLWSYELDLSPEEVDFLLDHLWEVGDSYYDYYFLSQNCGYHMLTVLQAAVPRLKLVDEVPFWVIPADALKAITRHPGLVRSVTWRPSIFAQMKADFALLDPEEKKLFLEVKKSKDLNRFKQAKSAESQARLMDVYIQNYDFTHAKKIADQDQTTLEARNKILSLRSGLPTVEARPVGQPSSTRPDLSHDSARFTVNGIRTNQENHRNIFNFDMRFSLHDSLDPQEGYPRFSTIEMFRFQAEHNQDLNRTNFTRFNFVNIEALTPFEELRKQKSWGVGLGWGTRREPDCFDCNVGFIRYGYGFSVNVFSDRDLFFALLYGQYLNGEDLKNRSHFIVEPRVGYLYNNDRWAFRLELSPQLSILNDSRYWLEKKLEVRRQFEWGKQQYVSAQYQEADQLDNFQLGYGFFF